MKKQTGRKALIVVSDGRDRGSKESFLNAMDAAQRADTLVNCILMKPEQPSRGGGLGGYGGMGRHGGLN